ncbi:hypothetical protein HYV30_01130 [Candidatus Kaiserbacteria bacterium]|nr:hypothetical protein [Candidatus Kaiserbacteria bacterium]
MPIKNYSGLFSVLAAGALIALAFLWSPPSSPKAAPSSDRAELAEVVLPTDGVTLPVIWGEIGAKLVESGAIDLEKLRALYESRGGFPAEYQKMLEKNHSEKVVITSWNAGYLLNLLWALGLANENPILEDKDEMMNPRYGGDGRPPAAGFASTGGWSLARGNVMDHYGKHRLISLTTDQQMLVDRVSRNIYRPCCGNSTHFPDCNHGMAMLGLLELMASQGVSEEEMYRTALAVNAYWFPDTYLTIAAYWRGKGVEWKDVRAKEVLGAAFSSASGYRNIAAQVAPQGASGGGSCSN